MGPERRLIAAATQWDDYVGTAAADGAEVVLDRPSLYELVGLDRDRWLVTAFDLEVVEGRLSATVYAFDRCADPDRQAPLDVQTVIGDRGHLPVTAFPLGEDTDTQSFLDQVFRRLTMRLVASDFRDDPMVVQDAETVGRDD